MAETFYTLLTKTGQAQLANATALGTKVNFSKLKVGDGNGSYYDPTETQIDLVHTVWSGNVSSVTIDENNPNWIIIESVIPSTDGDFTVREVGIYDDNNNLLAISKCAETYKPVISDGSTKELLMKIILVVTNTESVNLTINPTIVFATKQDINNLTTIVNNEISDLHFQIAGGTGTAITLTINQILVNGLSVTFIASANNSGNATTINGKPIYKPNTTTTPNLVAGKAYTIWYNSTGNCFFIKASAEGDVIASQVLAGKKFSNDDDTGLIGTMPINGTLNYSLPINGTYNIPSGYTTGGSITQSIPVKTAQTYNPSTSTQTISLGQYLSGNQVIAPVGGNATINDVVSGKTFSSANGINLVGQATISSLGGTVMHHTGGNANTYFAYHPSNSVFVNEFIDLSGIGFDPKIITGSVGGKTFACIRNINNSMNSYYDYSTNNTFENINCPINAISVCGRGQNNNYPSLSGYTSRSATWEAWGWE